MPHSITNGDARLAYLNNMWGIPHAFSAHRCAAETCFGGHMVKSELVDRISVQSRLLHQDYVAKIVEVILGEIAAAMARGDRVELRGFGAFSIRNRAARTGRNPRTQAYVLVKEKSVPCFKTGKEMRERLNRTPTI